MRGDDAAGRRPRAGRRHGAAATAPTARPLGAVDGLGDVVAVAGLSADRDTGEAFAVVDAFGAPTSLWKLPAGDGAALAWTVDARPPTTARAGRSSVQPGRRTRRSTARRSGCSSSTAATSTPGPDVPMILNGYGGFAIAETPVWSPQIAAWCAAGGAYAIAGLRGGLEEGEAWHHAGRRAHKQNVFDDFHAAADWLVATGLRRRATASPCSAAPTAGCSSAWR